jgi:hypothetical protein
MQYDIPGHIQSSIVTRVCVTCSIVYSSGSQPLWYRRLLSSFIRQGPVPTNARARYRAMAQQLRNTGQQYRHICSNTILAHCIHAEVYKFLISEEISEYLWSRYSYHTLLQKQLLVWNWKWICRGSYILPFHKQYKMGNTRGLHIICYCYNVLLVITLYYCISIPRACAEQLQFFLSEWWRNPLLRQEYPHIPRYTNRSSFWIQYTHESSWAN